MTTRAEFLATYEAQVRQYGWAADQVKLDAFMAQVRATLDGPGIPWAWDGAGAKAAWKAIGCKGRMTLKALRALP